MSATLSLDELNVSASHLHGQHHLQAEPPYKIYFILREQAARLRDVQPLKYEASLAENKGNLLLARQLWVRVLAASRGDWDAVDAIERIAIRQRENSEPVIPSEPVISSPTGERSITSEPAQESQISQSEAGHSLDSYDVRQRLRQLQQTLGLKDADTAAIEARVVEHRTIQPPIRHQPSQTTPLRIVNRRQFWKWAGFGGAGLVTAVVGREIFMHLSPDSTSLTSPESTPLPSPKPISLQSFQFKVEKVDSRGKITNTRPSLAKLFTEDLGNGVTLEMVEIPAGSFKMGSPSGEKDRDASEEPQHTVNVPTFFMGRYEVTQEQYQQVMGSNPSKFQGTKRPVESVSWKKAVEFCDKLSQKTGRKYRLPSETEWEYACRARTTTPFYFGETITTELANYNGNSIYASEPKSKYRQQTTDVGSFPPNAFGLYDMHGNVWEWCADTWHENYMGAPTNGNAWKMIMIINFGCCGVVRGASILRIAVLLLASVSTPLSTTTASVFVSSVVVRRRGLNSPWHFCSLPFALLLFTLCERIEPKLFED